MKVLLLLGLTTLLLGTCAHADSSMMQSEEKIGDQTRNRAPLVIKQFNFDFDNNTLGEMVIKLNTLIRAELKHRNENVVLELTGLTEPEITTVLNRRVVHWQPQPGLTLGQVVAQVAQFTGCTVSRQRDDLILTPTPPYTAQTFDVQKAAQPTPAQP